MTHSNRLRVLAIALLALVNVAPVFAADKVIVARATGNIIEREPCGLNLVCQVTEVSGFATGLGAITGVLQEQVDITTGQYTGTAVFTVANGDFITTSYVGQAFPPDEGITLFSETHTVTGGSGRFEDATGQLNVVGSADEATLEVSIVGVGVLNR